MDVSTDTVFRDQLINRRHRLEEILPITRESAKEDDLTLMAIHRTG